MESFISPKTRKGLKSSIHGKGFFAIKAIEKGEIVAIKRGTVLDKEELEKAGVHGRVELQVDDNKYIAPATENEFEQSMIFINYSCEPNLGMNGKDTIIAIRDILPDKELVLDYAMLVNDDSEIVCNCGSKNCRKVITGKDWMNPELQEKYKGYFTDYIQRKIDNSEEPI